MLIGDMSIDLGCADVAVTEHRLNTTDVGAVHEEVGGKAVSHRVRTDVFCDAGKSSIAGDDALNAPCRQTTVVAAC